MSLLTNVLKLWRTGQYLLPADSGFMPKHLFANGEPGFAKLDFSGFAGMYQDRARTVPYTAAEQLLGSFTGLNGVTATAPADANRGVVSARVNLLNDVATLATQSVTVAAGNYVLSFTGAGSVTLSGAATGVKGAGDNAITCTDGSLTLTVSGAVNNGFFRKASDSHLPFQWVNSPSDYDTAGFPHYILFNGTNTAYVTPSIDFTGTDKMTVWAGVTKLSDTGLQMITELSTNAGTTSGSFWFLGGDNTTGAPGWGGRSGGTTRPLMHGVDSAAPINSVLVLASDISGAVSSLRSNGALKATATSTHGTGSFASAPLFIGARAGTSLYFNGRLYSLIVRGAQSSKSQIEATELYIKQKMRLP